ncbi:MAG: TetR/AcrR family transcriptional regulator [Bacteroidota bacterium]
MGIQERKEREKEQRREEILNAAQKVFFEKGLQLATMDEIAEAAELSKGTLYLYYKSKEDLYLAVLVQGMETLRGMFAKATSTDQPTVERIKNLGTAYSDFFDSHRHYFRMFSFFEHPEFHKQVSSEMLNACAVENQKIWKLVVDLLDKGIREGVLRTDLDPAEMAVMLWISLSAILVRIDNQCDDFKNRLNVDLRDLYRKSSDLFLESLMTQEAKQKFGLAVFGR